MVTCMVVPRCWIAGEKLQKLQKSDQSSAIVDNVKTTGHNIKWNDFDILTYQCKVNKTLFIQELQPALNAKVCSEKLLLY